MTILAVDLACNRYADYGVCTLALRGERIAVERLRTAELGLRGRPSVDPFALGIARAAERCGARLIAIDGPQAWKAPGNGLEHSRVCERAVATQGKTGLPESAKPASFAGFTRFAVALFDRLAQLGWPRLDAAAQLGSSCRFALESFPTAGWRRLGLAPLPSKRRTPPGGVRAKALELQQLLSIDVPNDSTHDELQAVVAGLAGVAADGHASLTCSIEGVAPFRLEGHWREGFIVTPSMINTGVREAG